MDDSFRRTLEIISSNRSAFELLLREKQHLRHELVSVYYNTRSVWKHLPGEKEEKHKLLEKLLEKYTDEINQNQAFVDNQLLAALRSAEVSDRNQHFQSDFDQKILESQQKYQVQLDQVKKEKYAVLDNLKRALNSIINDLSETLGKSSEPESAFGLTGSKSKKEDLKNVPNEIESSIEKIRSQLNKLS